jgi:hypothetical protein
MTLGAEACKKELHLFCSVFCVSVPVFVAYPARTSQATPCKPCRTWGEIKTCFLPKPLPCCNCGKNPKDPYDPYEDSMGFSEEYYSSGLDEQEYAGYGPMQQVRKAFLRWWHFLLTELSLINY